MARSLLPFVQNGYYASRNWIPLVKGNGFTTSGGGEQEEVWETASGPIVTFDAVPAPLRQLSVAVEPVQDLNGYDSPWPAGGGKNLLPLTLDKIKAENTGTWSNNSYTNNGVTFTVNTDSNGNVIGIAANGTATSNASLRLPMPTTIPVGTSVTLNGNPRQSSVDARIWVGTSGYADIVADIGNGVTFDYVESVARIWLQVLNGKTFNGTFYPMIRLASETDPTFVPYSNICPISGFDSVTVNRTGKNLLPTWVPVANSNGLTSEVNDDGSVRIYGTATGTGGYISGFISIDNPLALKETSSIVGFTTSLPDRVRAFFRNNAGKQGSADVMAGQSSTPVNLLYVPYDFSRIAFYLSTTAGKAYDFTIYPQLELGSTATAYEPYNGNEYTIQLGETVYGGTLDVVNGKMTVDSKLFALKDLSWFTVTVYQPNFNAENGIVSVRAGNGQFAGKNIKGIFTPGVDAFCDYIKPRTGGMWNNVNSVDTWGRVDGVVITLHYTEIGLSAWTTNGEETLSAFQTTDIYNYGHVLLPLATPFELTLTPQEISTLQGTNNVWSDAGDVTVEYRAQ